MSKKYDAKLFQERSLKDSYKNSENLDFPNIFFDAISKGDIFKNQSLKIEYKRFDEDWLDNLETFFPSLIQITRNLKSSLRYEEEILPIEKTRRTNPESIRHLLRNTNLINDINSDGEIVPGRILNTLSEVEYGIYENRFIMTLVDRLYNYLFSRIEVIRANIMGSKEMNFDYDNSFNIESTNYQIKLNIKSNEEIDIQDIDVHNYRIYEKAEEAFKVISRIYHGQFMKVMKKYQKVKPPIMKTQIILKNPDFRNAYLLWLYMDRLNIIDFTLERKQKNVEFNENYIEQIDRSLLLMFSTVFINSSFDINDKKVITENIKPESIEEDYTENISIKPVDYVLEPNLATEYYLKKTKQNISQQFKKIERNSKTKEQSLKQVLIDQYSIANQVYNHYFEANQDDDVFDKLINFTNPVRRFDESLNKYLVSKTQREVTESLYFDALNLESKWIKESKILRKESYDFIVEKETQESDKIIKKLESESSKEINKYEKSLIENTKTILQNKRKRNIESIKKLRNDNKESLKIFRAKEKERLAKQKEVIKEKKQKERIKLKEKQQREKLRELEKLNKRKKQDQDALRSRLAKQKDEIKKKNQKIINDLKNKNN